jgi:cyclophilin family peptidyl-prolyl cis-trans isomerase
LNFELPYLLKERRIVMRRFILLAAAGVLVCTMSGNTAAAKNPIVVMKTSMGTIKIELDEAKAPGTVKNFLSYADDKFYDGTIFHRVISDFMIQGGGFQPGLKKKETKAPIKNEAPNGLSNVRGTIAMARLRDPDSATAQFYINVEDNSKKLDDQRYCVFGKVIEGMDVVDKIKAVKVENRGGYQAVPLKDVIIESVRRAEK